MASAVAGSSATVAAGITSAEEAQNTSKKPTDSLFKQQQLPAWQPILTAGSVLPIFFVIGVAFIPIGIGMYWFSAQVREYEHVYTDCTNAAGVACYKAINGTPIESRDCVCQHEFDLKDWDGDVFLYYGLENFYQNHRRYVKSRDNNQLLGDLSAKPETNCYPFSSDTVTNKTIVPCGAIANSLFSDEIKLQYQDPTNPGIWNDVPLVRTGIAWPSDIRYKFKNPVLKEGQTLEDVFSKFAKPKDWKKNLWELDKENPSNNGLQNEDLIVWMRTAALPNFRKLYRKINHNQEPFKKSLPDTKYKFVINYNFDVKAFAGSKSVILSTTSILGGKNSFLGIAYIVVGCICFVLGVIFLFVHIKYGKQHVDMMKVNSRSQFNG